jgi:hypothetical protein
MHNMHDDEANLFRSNKHNLINKRKTGNEEITTQGHNAHFEL